MSFIFYDTETTGTDTSFDQILQFAAIRTDGELNELERFEIRCRLHGYLAPSPGAMRVTGIGVQQLTDTSLPSHYEMVRAIRAKLQAWSPGVFVGYNSMSFDEPLLRQALYQTLHTPYLTITDGNCRADAMDLVQSVAFLAPEALKIPLGDNGKVSFKLDRLAPANDFNHENAHDALGDVEATIHMCRLIRDRCPDAWSNFSRFSQRAAVVDYVSAEPEFVYLAHYFNRPYPYAVHVLGFDEEQTSVAYVIDLATDMPELAAMTDEKLAARLRRSPKPVRKLKANTAPFLMDRFDAPDHVQQRLPSENIAQANLAWLEANPDFVARVLDIYQSGQDEFEPAIHLEQKIHESFLEKIDLQTLEEFHEAAWEDRHAIVERIVDERYQQLGRRLIYCERPDLLPEQVRTAIELEMNGRLLGTELGGEPWLTLPKALEQTDDFFGSAEGDELKLLTELREYLAARLHELTGH